MVPIQIGIIESRVLCSSPSIYGNYECIYPKRDGCQQGMDCQLENQMEAGEFIDIENYQNSGAEALFATLCCADPHELFELNVHT